MSKDGSVNLVLLNVEHEYAKKTHLNTVMGNFSEVSKAEVVMLLSFITDTNLYVRVGFFPCFSKIH